VIGATNRLHLIDSAFRSRFDKIIEVSKPDREAAYSIASIYSKKIPIDYYLIQEKAGDAEARAHLVDEIVNYMYGDQYVDTEIGRIKREDTITGRFIAQIFGYARDKALEERTMLMLRKGAISNEELKKMWDKEGIAEILDAGHRADDLLKRYKQIEEIGVTLRHLKEGFDKFVQRRAEEMLASGYEEIPNEETGMHF
jgi:SpoVK/Ycf46/Vps4 family AAA+-type ATPase